MGDLVCSKALDNRAGCFVLLEVLKKIKNSKYDLYFVFSVQEELGLRGAKTITYSIEPDIGLSVDVTSTVMCRIAPRWM
jgi:endoglucanase